MERPNTESILQPSAPTERHVADAVKMFDAMCNEIKADDPNNPMRPDEFVAGVKALNRPLGNVMEQIVDLGSTDRDKMLIANGIFVAVHAMRMGLDPQGDNMPDKE